MKASQMIKDFYEMESEIGHQESLETKFSVKTKVEDAAMLAVLAERFETTRIALVEPIIRSAVLEMVQALSPEDKVKLCEAADKEATELLKKMGHDTSEWQASTGAGHIKGEAFDWRMWLGADSYVKGKFGKDAEVSK